MKKTIIAIIAAAMIAATTAPASAAVDGITADNYQDWIKPNPDAYGYNIGECDREYLPGEEYFYNEHIDHWNVDRVYDPAALPKPAAKPAAKKPATTDKGLVKAYCQKKYKGYRVKYVKAGAKILKHRKGKKTVFVEIVKTTAKGGRIGKTKSGHTIKYNKKAKKGQKITVYLIYNPKNNAPDDVKAVVTQKKIRK